jgi:hypothetical protein
MYYSAGKALDERKAEIRIQFKEVPGSHFLFGGQNAPCNELVMRLQPDQAVYFKVICVIIFCIPLFNLKIDECSGKREGARFIQ